jgi:hypothetical protein
MRHRHRPPHGPDQRLIAPHERQFEPYRQFKGCHIVAGELAAQTSWTSGKGEKHRENAFFKKAAWVSISVKRSAPAFAASPDAHPVRRAD